MRKTFGLVIVLAILALVEACQPKTKKTEEMAASSANSNQADRINIGNLLDSLNIAAAEANFDRYFEYFSPTATYNGTDATENWSKQEFMVWAKPYFDNKSTWNFKSIRRKIYFGKYGDIAWFEELLDTQMKICRGSGVVIKVNGKWKIEQYVLSMTIPNQVIDPVIEKKKLLEDKLIKELTGNSN